MDKCLGQEVWMYENIGYVKTRNANVMSVAIIPADHMEAKMQLEYIVQLNCQSAPLKIEHTAESSGGCGTREGKKRTFTGKQ